MLILSFACCSQTNVILYVIQGDSLHWPFFDKLSFGICLICGIANVLSISGWLAPVTVGSSKKYEPPISYLGEVYSAPYLRKAFYHFFFKYVTFLQFFLCIFMHHVWKKSLFLYLQFVTNHMSILLKTGQWKESPCIMHSHWFQIFSSQKEKIWINVCALAKYSRTLMLYHCINFWQFWKLM